MWITANGVAHTVALPDWRVVVSDEGDRLEQLSAAEWSSLEVALSEYEEEVFTELENLSATPALEDRFVGMVPPPLEVWPPGAGESLAAAVLSSIAQADIRWRLDYLLAIQDACDEILNPPSR